MHRLILTAAAVAALTAGAQGADLMMDPVVGTETPALSPSGDVMIYGGWFALRSNEDGYEIPDASLFGFAARLNLWVAPNFSTQFDVNGESVFDGADDNFYDYQMYNAAAHANWRAADMLLGGFVSVGHTADYIEGTFATIGAEALIDMGHVQFYGQAGFTKSIDLVDDSYDVSAPYVRGELRYFVNPNLMLSANAGYVHQSYADDDLIESLTWGAQVEYRFDNSPISVLGIYRGNYETESDEDENWNSNAVLAGLKFNFGSDTLEEAAKTGPTLRDYNPITGVEHTMYNDWL